MTLLRYLQLKETVLGKVSKHVMISQLVSDNHSVFLAVTVYLSFSLPKFLSNASSSTIRSPERNDNPECLSYFSSIHSGHVRSHRLFQLANLQIYSISC